MLRTMLTEMKRQAGDALTQKEDGRARWFYEWADLFLGAFEGKKPVVYTSFYAFPMEILYAADVAPFDFELASSMLLTLPIGADLIGEAEDRGYSPDICSFHRASIASWFRGHFPKPDLMLSTSFYCGGKAKTSEVIAHLFGCPSLLLDVPNEVTKESVVYVKRQLVEAAEKIASLTGRSFDEDRLREAVGHANRARASHRALLDLLKHRPSPWGGNQLVNYSIFSRMFDGSPKLADIHDGFARKLTERIDNKKLRSERHRVFWYAWVPTYKSVLFDTLARHEVSVPVCETFLIHWDEIDERDPFEGLALKCLNDPFVGRVDRRTGLLDEVVDKFGIDGVILFATPACRHSKGNWAIMKGAWADHGIPFLTLDMDIADPRAYAEEQIRTRIEGFIEVLDGPRAAKTI
jgi:benzoyl-CoA reductase/2-hydroxyglutaryl-CoA dehydratase subunit BcrC/BadD/HgdB